jgi:ribosomal protein L31E
MTRHTFNISKARVAGPNKRSKKAMSILREKLQEAEGDVSISPELNQEVWRKGGSNPPSKISVDVEQVGDRKIARPVEEPQRKSTTQESSSKDYSDVVGGTVGDAKDAISEMEDPDYEALLEAEKSGKDRKTLKEFIEGKMEG